MTVAASLPDRRAHLSRKLGAVGRLVAHLEFSRRRLPYPLSSIDALTETELESVSALIERFGKLQDLLGGIFREVAILSGEEADDMNDVLGRMEKIGILSSADEWRALRALRNLGAHDYDDNDAGKTEFVNESARQATILIEVAGRVASYCRDKLNIETN